MKIRTVMGVLICVALVTGCVSTKTYKQSLAELDDARKALESSKKQLAELEEARKALESSKKQAAAEAESLQKELVDVNARVASLASGKTTAQEEIARLQLSERDQELNERLKAEAAEKIRLEQERAARVAEIQQQQEQLKAEAADKTRLEQERAAKDAEIQRLTRTHEELTKSLQAEIAKGDIKIKQVRDRLTINMVDRVLFDSGQSKVKPSGLKVLKQVSDILKNVTDKQIRIEGHTDNVPIGVKLKDRFQTNWELSTARATSVVRYLIEEGGVDRANLSAVGYADTKPIASNETEEGRTANRRIEIALYPKDLSEIANQLKP